MWPIYIYILSSKVFYLSCKERIDRWYMNTFENDDRKCQSHCLSTAQWHCFSHWIDRRITVHPLIHIHCVCLLISILNATIFMDYLRICCMTLQIRHQTRPEATAEYGADFFSGATILYMYLLGLKQNQMEIYKWGLMIYIVQSDRK